MMEDTDNPNIMLTVQAWLMVAEVFYILTILVFKISLGMFFLRILTRPWQRHIAYTAMSLSSVFGFAYLLITIFACRHTEPGWGTAVKRWWAERCINYEVVLSMTYAHGAIGSTTDFLFVWLPLPFLSRSRMSKREKGTVGFILFLAVA